MPSAINHDSLFTENLYLNFTYAKLTMIFYDIQIK